MLNKLEKNMSDKLDLDTLIMWGKNGNFDDFLQKTAEYMPTDSKQNREQAREIYDMIKNGADRDAIMNVLEEALDGRERKGMVKGIAIGATVVGGLALLAAAILGKDN